MPAQLNTAKTAKLLAAPTLTAAILVSTNNAANAAKLANGVAAAAANLKPETPYLFAPPKDNLS